MPQNPERSVRVFRLIAMLLLALGRMDMLDVPGRPQWWEHTRTELVPLTPLEPSAAELDRMLAAMLAVIIVVAIATYTRFYFVSWLGERVTADLRRAVFDHLLRLPPSFFEITRTGEVISRLTNDTTMLETIIGSSASMAIRNSLLMIGGFVMTWLILPYLLQL